MQLRSTGQYDATLQITAKTSRTIEFRKDNRSYIWIGEQETFQGPRKYTSEGSILNETVTLTYETRKVSGAPLNQLTVTYFGDDPRLIWRDKLTLSDVKPILKEWGY